MFALFIAEKLGVSAPACGKHLRLLSQAGLFRGKKIKQWVFCKRDEDRIAQAKETNGFRPTAGLGLSGRAEATPWDEGLGQAMAAADVAVHEEAIIDLLLADLR